MISHKVSLPTYISLFILGIGACLGSDESPKGILLVHDFPVVISEDSIGETVLAADLFNSTYPGVLTLSSPGQFGRYILCAYDRCASPEAHEYWAIRVDGEYAQLGIDSLTLQANQTLQLTLETYEVYVAPIEGVGVSLEFSTGSPIPNTTDLTTGISTLFGVVESDVTVLSTMSSGRVEILISTHNSSRQAELQAIADSLTALEVGEVWPGSAVASISSAGVLRECTQGTTVTNSSTDCSGLVTHQTCAFVCDQGLTPSGTHTCHPDQTLRGGTCSPPHDTNHTSDDSWGSEQWWCLVVAVVAVVLTAVTLLLVTHSLGKGASRCAKSTVGVHQTANGSRDARSQIVSVSAI